MVLNRYTPEHGNVEKSTELFPIEVSEELQNVFSSNTLGVAVGSLLTNSASHCRWQSQTNRSLFERDLLQIECLMDDAC